MNLPPSLNSLNWFICKGEKCSIRHTLQYSIYFRHSLSQITWEWATPKHRPLKIGRQAKAFKAAVIICILLPSGEFAAGVRSDHSNIFCRKQALQQTMAWSFGKMCCRDMESEIMSLSPRVNKPAHIHYRALHWTSNVYWPAGDKWEPFPCMNWTHLLQFRIDSLSWQPTPCGHEIRNCIISTEIDLRKRK